MKYLHVILLVLIINTAEAFDNKITHPDITKSASNTPSFVSYIINIGFKDGLNTKFPTRTGKDILFLLQDGANLEDVPTCRAANHFHNPLLSWGQSQSTDLWPQDQICRLLGWTPRYSNITWATGLSSPNDTPRLRNKQDMGWDNARAYFYNALISSDAAIRETFFAKSFQALGQTLHLLQDMAVPAHVRNDFLSHLIWSGTTWNNILNPTDWVANPFEAYVKKTPTLITSIPQSQIYSPSITGAIASDFWDTDGRPGSPTLQGLAESTNAGYFSDFTIPGNPHIPFVQAHTFPLPQLVPTYTCADKAPGSIWKRKYASRFPCPTAGGSVDHFAAISSFTPRLLGMPPLPLPFINMYALDDNVHNTYANELLPRAVGYSAALLDYFFRGKIKITAKPADISFRSVKVNVQNNTPGETMGVGEVKLIIRYKALSEMNIGGYKFQLNYPPEDSSPDKYTYKVSIPQYVDLTNPQTLNFDFSTDTLPYFFSDMTMQLVFKGKLGNEEGAVAVSPPEPINGIYSDFTVSLPASGVYAKTTDSTLGATFSELKVTAQTDTPGGLTGGSFELALKYRKAATDPFQSVPVDTEPANAAAYLIRVVEKYGASILQPGTPVELTFDLSSVLLPVSATDVYLNIIYKSSGTLKTMAVGVNDISEPTPVDVFNNTDRVCIGNQWYVSGSPEAYAAVGVDNYGDPLDDIFSHRMDNVYFWTAGSGTLSFPLDPAARNLVISGANPGEVTRLGYILTNYTSDFAFDEEVTALDSRDDWEMMYDNIIYPGTGFTNQADKGFSGMYTIRGKKMWWGASVVYDLNDDSDSLCGWERLQ